MTAKLTRLIYHHVTPTLVVFALFVTSFPVAMKYSQSFKFVDEDEHMVIGDLMNRGYRLYDDVSTNHQPFPYLVSAAWQRLDRPDNLIMLVRRHRQLVWGWALAWCLLIALRFGWHAVPIIAVYESLKYLALGNEFLAESLVVYPLLYLLLGTMRPRPPNRLKDIEAVFLGMLGGFCCFTLLPLVPVCLALFVYAWFTHGKKACFLALMGLGVSVMGVFLFVSPSDYWRETIVNNSRYAAPRLNQVQNWEHRWQLLIYPWRHALASNLHAYWSRVVLLVLGVSLIRFAWKRQWRQFGWLVVAYGIWLLANLRVVKADVLFFEAFHLLPWLLIGTAIAILAIVRLWPSWSMPYRLIVLIVLGLFGIAYTSNAGSPWKANIDPLTENYIQYTPIFQTSQVLDAYKVENDRLMSFPAETLPYWLSRLHPADGLVTHYEWQYYPARNQQRFEQVLKTELPEFILFTDDGSAYVPIVKPILDEHYQLAFAFIAGPNPTGLYVLNERVVSLDAAKRQAILETFAKMEAEPPGWLVEASASD